MKACAGAHYWAREIGKLGVRLIAPAYVAPSVKQQKNDAADAEAICEAAERPSMRFVPVNTGSSRRPVSCSEPGIFWSVRAPITSNLRAGTV
jgi:transposase